MQGPDKPLHRGLCLAGDTLQVMHCMVLEADAGSEAVKTACGCISLAAGMLKQLACVLGHAACMYRRATTAPTTSGLPLHPHGLPRRRGGGRQPSPPQRRAVMRRMMQV